MKVILKSDSDVLGKRGDIVKVKGGYARNYLLPRGLAVEATSGNLKTLEAEKEVIARRETKEIEAAEKVASQIEGQVFKLKVKAGGGKLYGAVTPKEIAAVIAQDKGISIDKKKIVLQENIKKLGKHKVALKLHTEVEAKVDIDVEAEKEEKAQGESSGDEKQEEK